MESLGWKEFCGWGDQKGGCYPQDGGGAGPGQGGPNRGAEECVDILDVYGTW